jgi:ADP-ribose pyrophosphatase
MSIPKHAKPVFAGNQFTVYQWEETLFDGTKAVFEAAKRSNSVKAIAVTKSGTILVNEEEQPWKGTMVVIPGGIMEDGEESEEAIRREVLEETGYCPESLELFLTESAGYRLECDRFTFIARGCEKIQDPVLDAGEKIETVEMNLDGFIKAVLDGEIRARDLQREFLIEYRKDPSLSGLKRRILGN